MREGVIIIPPTPGSMLAKELQSVCREEVKASNISISITERGDTTHDQVIGAKKPGASRRKHCRRENCTALFVGKITSLHNTQERQGGICSSEVLNT